MEVSGRLSQYTAFRLCPQWWKDIKFLARMPVRLSTADDPSGDVEILRCAQDDKEEAQYDWKTSNTEGGEGSGEMNREILRFAQNDNQGFRMTGEG